MRKLIATTSVMIVFMSAHEDISTREQGLNTGAIAFLQKPFDDHILIEKINSALSRFADANQNKKDKEQWEK